MKISIIIPVYLSEAYIGSCIDSIFHQECNEADIECIIVDDCSEDRSMEIIASKLNEYHGKIQFIMIRHEVNRGHCAARNTALAEAKGDYVMFVDSDDCII